MKRDSRRTSTTGPRRGRIRAALLSLLLLTNVLVASSIVRPPSAGAEVYNVFPSDQFGIPENVFRADDALFVTLTSDLQGGVVCVVAATVEHHGQANCQSPAWGSPNFYVGIGTLLGMPLEAPLLPVGEWRLLGATPNGSQGTYLSDTFRVLPCSGECDTGPATEALAAWKARAGNVGSTGRAVCFALDTKDAIDDVVGAINTARGMYALAGGGLAGMAIGGIAGAASFFLDGPSSTEAMAMKIFRDLSCGVSQMMADIADDPPDFDYREIAQPVFRYAGHDLPDLGSAAADYEDLLEVLEATEAYGVASRIAFERYQGAMIDEEWAAASMQADATAFFTRELVRAMRALEWLLDDVATLAIMDGPVTTPEDLAEAIALRERIGDVGFTADEVAELEALDFDETGIAQIEAAVGQLRWTSGAPFDPDEFDPSVSLRAWLQDLADDMADSIDDFDTFGRQMSVAAAELAADVVDNRPPVASFIADPVEGDAPLTVTFTSTATDPDGDELHLTWDIAGEAIIEGQEVVTYTFEQPAIYYVSLVADDGEWWDQAIQEIRVFPPGGGPEPNEPPVASFARSPDGPVTIGESVTFTSTSTDPDGDELTASWHFGDGVVLHGDEVTRSFDVSAFYSVVLLVSDGELSDTAAGEIQVLGEAPNHPPVASFTATPSSGEAPLEVTFTSTSTDPDGDELTLTWDLGDGTVIEDGDTTLTHTYADPGTYTVTLTVHDGHLFDTTVDAIVVDEAPPSVEADFTVSKGYDAAKAGSGARVVSVSSEFNAATLASNILLPTATLWQTANGAIAGEEVIVELGGHGRDLIDEVVLLGGSAATAAREVEIALSTDGIADDDFVTVATGEVEQSNTVQTPFTFAPQRARFVRITILDNHGSTLRASLRELTVPTDDRAGGIVSLPSGPQAHVVDVSNEIPNSPAANALNRAPGNRWATQSGQGTDHWMRVELGGEGSHLVNRAVVRGANTTADLREFEVWVSETGEPGSFVEVLSAEAERSNQPQLFSFPPTEARFAELRVRSSHGGAFIGVNAFHVVTAHGLNVADGEGVGATISSVSSENAATPALNAIVHVPTSQWNTPTGENTDQHLSVLLRNGEAHVIDRVMVRSTANRPRNVEVWVSDTGVPTDYNPVAARELTNTSDDHWLVFPPVEARFVQLRVLDSYTTSVRVNELRVFSVERGGGDDVTFVDLSDTPADGLTSWSWDFGDGATSTERYPVHTFPGPGTYQVSLTVTDTDGAQSTRIRPYTVPAAPPLVAVPTAGSTTVNEMQNVNVRGESQGVPVVQWDWSHNTYGVSQLGNQQANVRFPDQGTYEVSVRGLSADWLWTESPLLTFEVLNVAPSVNAGSNVTIYATDTFQPTNSTATDPADPLVCTWDWGDGTPLVTIDPCTSVATRIPHTYMLPGNYIRTLTADDGDGGVTAATAQVNVLFRPTFVHVLGADRDGDDLRVVARLHDGITGARVTDSELTVSTLDPVAEITATTDGDGEIDVVLPGAGAAEEVTVAFAGDPIREPSSQHRPVGWLPEADIVFIIDESNSMGSYQQAVLARVREISQNLGPHLDFRLGLVGYAGGYTQGFGHVIAELGNDLTAFTEALGELRISSTSANGYEGVVVGMSEELGFRPVAASCGVLISDAGASEINAAIPNTTREEAIAALTLRNTPLFAITAQDVNTQAAYGVPDGLAGLSGGDWWFIGQFINNATEVLASLTSGCVTAALTPDLAIVKDSGVDVVGPGEEVTYTLTVNNKGAVPVTGVEVADTLPDHATFVSASQGGTEQDGVVTWPTFDLGVGGEVERTVTVRTASAEQLGVGDHPIVNVATVTDDGTQGEDRNPADNEDSDETIIQVVPNEPPVAGFAADPPVGEAPLAVTFTSTSFDPDGDDLTLTWDFGDGTVIEDGDEVVLHVYTEPGDYTVTLTVDDGELTDVATGEVEVFQPLPQNQPPVAGFTADPPVGEAPLVVTFTSTSFDPDGDDLTLTWDFGDGTVIVGGDPVVVHVYTEPGEYEVSLTVDDGELTDVATGEIEVFQPLPQNQPPIAGFTADPPVGEAPLAVTFTSTSFDPDGDDLTFTWDFGDGTVIEDGDEVVLHVYTEPGDYTVTLTVDDGELTDVATGEIEVFQPLPQNQPPVAGFTADPPVGEAPLVVTFTSTSSDPDGDDLTLTWDFGDGTVIVGGDPVVVHVYTEPGEYEVSLTVDDGELTDVAFDEVVATQPLPQNQPPVAGFTADPPVGEAPLAVTFTSTSFDPDGDDLTFTWDFGDGTVIEDGDEVVLHVYTEPGDYTVTLTVDDGELTDVATGEIEVFQPLPQNQPPVAGFTADPPVGEAPLAVTFTSTSFDPDGDDLTLTWDFGDGTILTDSAVLTVASTPPTTTSSHETVTHTYLEPGTYVVTLTADDGQETDTATAEIVVTQASTPPPPPEPPTEEPPTEEPPPAEEPPVQVVEREQPPARLTSPELPASGGPLVVLVLLALGLLTAGGTIEGALRRRRHDREG